MKTIVNWTLYALFASLFLFEGFLGPGLTNRGLHLFPHKLSYTQELLVCIITLYLIIIYGLNKKLSIRIAYLFFFFFFLTHALTGIVFNTVPSGAILGGIRRYFLFMPLFFLPMAYQFSESEIKKQLKLLLFLGLIQCPFAIYQRFFLFGHYSTGDYVTGTLLVSSILSMFQIFCITVLTGFYIKKQIKLPFYIVLSLILFIPTTLNETKGTLILFPIAMCITILFGTGKILNLKKFTLIAIGALMMAFVFVPLYGYLYPRVNLVNFFKGKGEKTRSLQGYLYKGLSEDELEDIEPGRIDTLLYPFSVLSKEPAKLIIGLGIGNVNPAGVKMFSGEYTQYEKYGAKGLAATSLIWETGLIGFFLYVLFLWLVLKDALTIRSIDDMIGNLALGWIGVVIVLGLSFFYKNALHSKVIVYLFWYFSGHIAAKRANFAAHRTKSTSATWSTAPDISPSA